MNDQEHNHDNHGEAVSDPSLSQDGKPVASRRRLLKIGVSTAPVVLTLTSRPVLAWHCKTPSVAASANTSHTAHTVANEGTQTIDHWASTSPWPGFDKKTVTLGTMFGTSETTKCKTAISSTSTPALKKYLIAAMLNIQPSVSVSGQCLTADQIKQMYKDGPSGNYDPLLGSNIRWGSNDIIAYLKNNWIVTG